MPVSVFNKFDCYVADVHNAVHDHSTATHKVLLTNVAPLRTNTVIGDITEIAPGFGYNAGGNVATLVSSAQTAGLYRLILADPADWVASGGDFPTFRYAVLYNSDNGALIGWYDYGTGVTVHAGETFILDLDQVEGVVRDQ